MNFDQVQAQLTDLPATFRRQGNPFGQFIDALTAQLERMAMASDGQVAQGTFAQSMAGWVDTWGMLMNVLRGQNQPDGAYKNQIGYTVNARGGPPLAISQWIYFIFGIQVQIVENIIDQNITTLSGVPIITETGQEIVTLQSIGGLGYTIIFPANVTPAQIAQIIASISYVRPAGVPFNVQVASDGTYVQTINFVNAPKVTGAYLASGVAAATPSLSAGTNNSPPSIPTLFLTDPTLNP